MSRPLRQVMIWDERQQRRLTFLTNLVHLAASTIAAIYKERWQIELLFKALKQHLKIKTFVGTRENAVQGPIWIALIAMVLLKFLQLKSTGLWSLSNLAALLRFNQLTYRDLWTRLNAPFERRSIARDVLCDMIWTAAVTSSSMNRSRGRLKRSIHAGGIWGDKLFGTAVRIAPFPCTSRRVIHNFESSQEENGDRLSYHLFFLRSSALLLIVGGESCEEARSGLTNGLTRDSPLPFIEVKAELAAWGEAQERLSILEPELIALNLRGVAHAYEGGSLPPEQGITEAFFLSQPALFRFPRASPSSQLFTPLNAYIQQALSQFHDSLLVRSLW